MSNPIRDILTRAKELATGVTWNVLGEKITYRFSNGTTIENVICLPVGQDVVDNPNPGAAIRRDTLRFSIPRQATWPGGNTPNNFDSITYREVTYFIKSATWDNLNAIWSVTVEKKKSLTA